MATVLAVLAPLVGVPLTVILFHLKGQREQMRTRLADLAERIAMHGVALERVREEVTALQRDYATKEEWLREGMWARGQIERLAAIITRSQAVLEQLSTAPATAERAVRAVQRLERWLQRDAAGEREQWKWGERIREPARNLAPAEIGGGARKDSRTSLIGEEQN
jgi:chromosome segregation ATPase